MGTSHLIGRMLAPMAEAGMPMQHPGLCVISV
jgi:hypothetical protein